MKLDEVYQAALAAGSGGIRWNSVTNYIQLADENKNWIDWQYFGFKPNLVLTQLNGAISGTVYTCPQAGLYAVWTCVLAGAPSISYTGTVVASDVQNTYKSYIIYCNTGDTISASGGNYQYNGIYSIAYIGSQESARLITSKGGSNTSASVVLNNVSFGIAIGSTSTNGNTTYLTINATGELFSSDSYNNGNYKSIIVSVNSINTSVTITSNGATSNGGAALAAVYQIL